MMETYIGKTISDFTLQSSDGQTISLGSLRGPGSLRGQKVLLYFFTSPGGGRLNPHGSWVPRACCRVHREERRAVRNP